MALPLPRVVADVGPGGPLVTAMGGINALANNMLKTKYYAPNIQSEIENRNALTDRLKTMTPLEAAELSLKNQFYGPNMQSEMNNRNALTQRYNTMTPLEAEELRLKNELYPDVTRNAIKANEALANYRNTGGAAGGVDQKQLQGLQNQIAMDNPQWDRLRANQAASAYLSGNNVLPDGTPLPPPSGLVQDYLDSRGKKATTAALLTSGVKANQAQAELKVLNKYANEGMKPYGTTYFNKSPQQVVDTFKSDPESQKRLGRFIASQALQFETAQNRIRLAQGQPGVTATEELMKLSGQLIKTNYPRLSGTAREEAIKYLDEALEKGLEARQTVKLSASGAMNNNRNNPQKPNAIDTSKYDVPAGSILMHKNGEPYFFPADQAEARIDEGYTYE